MEYIPHDAAVTCSDYSVAGKIKSQADEVVSTGQICLKRTKLSQADEYFYPFTVGSNYPKLCEILKFSYLASYISNI